MSFIHKKAHEPVPTLNSFIRGTLLKGESGSYSDGLEALASYRNRADDPKAPRDLDGERLLSRLLQHGHITIASVQPILDAVKAAGTRGKDDRSISRFVYYLTQLMLGDGSAGTPLPVPVSKGNSVLPKAVDRFGPEVLSASWADLGVEASPFMSKQSAMRSLAALARASLTSHPDDPTYLGGLLVTLQSLLDSLDTLQAKKKNTLANLMAQHTGGASATAAAGSSKKKSSIAEFRSRMEVWALMRIAFSAARVALSTSSGIGKIALRCFPGIFSADPVGARHALALASLAARDPQASRAYISEVGTALARNVDLAKRTGLMFSGGKGAAPKPGASAAAGGSPPEISREEPEGFLNLRDPWARVYLARGCAAVIQSGHIAGNLTGSGAVFWEALQFLALADPSEMVALEAVRAMFGAPYPKADASIRKKTGGAQDAAADSDSVQARVCGASWHMNMSAAEEATSVPDWALQVEPGPGAAVAAATPAATEDGVPPAGTSSLFACLSARLSKALKSRARSLVCSAAKTVGAMAEARAWCSSMNGGARVEGDAVTKSLAKLQSSLQAIVASDSSVFGSCEKHHALEALLWLQQAGSCGGGGGQQLVTPGILLKCMVHGGHTVLTVVRVLFADPWPEGLVSSLLSTVNRCARCTPGQSAAASGAAIDADMALELAAAMAVAAPSRVSREQMQAMLDAAPGTSALRVAISLLSAPLPPITQPNCNAPVEVKVLAAGEEAAFEGLKGIAAWWLGEHANQVAGSSAWKPVGKAPVELQMGSWVGAATSNPEERMALAAAVHNPALALVISHLQRALLTGAWELRCTAAQALAKVAVRSREPYRIQCYAALAATQRPAVAASGGGGGGAAVDAADHMALAAVVRPALEVLDAMYAGELVVKQQSSRFGRTASSWPTAAIASLRRRHEHLIFLVLQRIGFVPREMFYPLGPFSKRLLKPEEPLDEEEEEEEKQHRAAPTHIPMGLPKNILEAAKAAAAAAVAAEQQLVSPAAQEQHEEGQYDYDQQYNYDQQYYDHQYDDAADDQYNDGSYRPGNRESDPLASWQEGAYGAITRVAVHIPSGDDDASSSVQAGGTEYADDEDYRWGTVQYTFAGEASDEVSVSSGERVKVLTDMGEWLHVLTLSGARGLVPSSYISTEQGGGGGPGGDGYSVVSSQMYGGNAYATEQYYYGEGTAAAGSPQLQKSYSVATSALSESSSFRGTAPESLQAAFYGGASNQQTYYQNDAYDGEEPAAAASGGYDAFEEREPTTASKRSSVDYQPGYSTSPSFPRQREAAPEEIPATVAYEFVAEQDNELTVRVGDQVVVGAEVDGWYLTTRLSDGASGLVPASYVQLQG